jgi:hypothetical protein
MVKLRKYRRRGVPTGEWEVDVRLELANGEVFRQRVIYRDSPSKVEARAWGEDREHEVRRLARQGLDLDTIRRAVRGEEVTGKTEVPTLAGFKDRFIEGHVKANRLKPSSASTVDTLLRAHLEPAFGSLRLDGISDELVQRFKGELVEDELSNSRSTTS